MAHIGVAGLEAIYGRYSEDQRAMLTSLGRRQDLVVTDGSDYLGTYKPDLRVGIGQGDLAVPAEVLDRLEARRPRWAGA